ncbi:ATP-binding cassette sub-family A member 2-like [Gymnodraco acuticeps]|uniref:ATP-binding cassette sub-family A member 2-like n=1 Tax=Gymnodraco acuticeps TaxID=8218 RepID=A0A6P8TKM2_GYMAC|nr:ATP-binding cassette sub-family A member 2-like [Gymnodraco acuticeps]
MRCKLLMEADDLTWGYDERPGKSFPVALDPVRCRCRESCDKLLQCHLLHNVLSGVLSRSEPAPRGIEELLRVGEGMAGVLKGDGPELAAMPLRRAAQAPGDRCGDCHLHYCGHVFVPASFVVFLVAEKSTKAKHLQFVSGCDPVIYWLANYIWDMLNYLVPATCCVIILFVFDLPAYTSPTNFPAVLSLFLLYGWSITPIMYPASFWFEVPSTAYVFLIVINLFIGITATVATFLLQLFEHDKDLKRINSYLKSCFLIFPNYNLGHGLMEMAYNEYINEYYAKIGQFDKMKSPFEWDIVTRGLVAMTIEGFVGFLITILCQYNFLRKPPRMPVSCQPIDDDDVDVACERRRVLRGDADNDKLKIDNLTKVHP